MEYRNTKTGVTFSSPCTISGGDWVLVEKEKQSIKREESDQEVIADSKIKEEQEQDTVQTENEVETGNAEYDSITVPQIKQELDAFGVEYNPRAKKQELYDLMMSQGK